MPTKFKSFEEFGQAAKQERVENLKQQIDNIFEKSIKDDFDSIPEGPFKSSLPGISWIAFARPTDRKTGERSTGTLNAVIFSKNESGKDVNHTWAVNKDGAIKPIQKIPPELTKKYGQEEIALEIASLLERIGPSFFHLTDLDIIPAQDPGAPRKEDGTDGPDVIDGGRENPIDPEREKFIRSLPNAKFATVNREKGLRGYMVVFLDGTDVVYVENQAYDNAAFVGDILPEKVNMKDIEEEISAQKEQAGQDKKVSKDELRKAVEERYWAPISEKVKTRSDLVSLGAKRYVHTPGKWQENVRQAIESRTQQ